MIFGVSYSIIVRLIEARLTYYQIFILQSIISALIFIPIALANPYRKQIAPRDILPIMLCAVVTIYGWSLLTLKGIAHTTPLDVAAISTLGPTITILAAAINQKRSRLKSSRRHLTKSEVRTVVTPMILLLLVAMVILHEMPLIVTLQNLKGNITIVVAVICMGISTVIVSNLQESYGTTTILAVYFAVALLLMPLFIPNFTQQITEITKLDIKWQTLCLLPAVTMTLPLYLLYSAAAKLTPLHTALYRYIQPMIALLVIVVEAKHHSDLLRLRPLLAQEATILILTLLLLLLSTMLMPNGNNK